MKINIKGTNLKLTPSIYSYIDKKIGELDKFVKHIGNVEAWVEVGRISKHHRKGDVFRAEVQIRLPHTQGVRAVSEQLDLHIAIDEVKNEMQRQLKRYKDKQRDAHNREMRKLKNKTHLSKLVRKKRE